METAEIIVPAPHTPRVHDWPERLHTIIAERQAMPFTWGEHDCCLWVCDCIRAMTGHDPAAETFRGKYTDALGANRLLAQFGGVEAIAEQQCDAAGFCPVGVTFAQRGDVLLVELDENSGTVDGAGRPALGICDGSHAVIPGRTGLQWVPLALARRAWRVG